MSRTTFALRAAASPSLSVGLAAAILVETTVLHLWLTGAGHARWALASTLLGVFTIAWLLLDAAAMRRALVHVDDASLTLAIGRRWNATLPRAGLLSVAPLTWKDVPDPATARDYRNLTKPAEPNVLLAWREPVTVRGPGGVMVRMTRMGLHVDDAAGFVAALGG